MLNFLTESKWYFSAAQCFGVLIALAMILMNMNSVRLPLSVPSAHAEWTSCVAPICASL